MRWSNANYMLNNKTTKIPKSLISKAPNKGKPQDQPDKGHLLACVPEPNKFVADPNHQRKVLTGELVKLANAKVTVKETMTRMDSTCIGKNFGFFIQGLTRMDECQYIEASKAMIEHYFDEHKYCGS
jgi:hypothetical protein